MNELESVRIDKWLWAVRICKTRSDASDLCDRGRVCIDGQLAKSSRKVKVGQMILVKKQGIDWEYKVLKCIEKRVGAKIAIECKEDLTDPLALKRLEQARISRPPQRPKGAGRPTKKERRQIDQLNDYDFM